MKQQSKSTEVPFVGVTTVANQEVNLISEKPVEWKEGYSDVRWQKDGKTLRTFVKTSDILFVS